MRNLKSLKLGLAVLTAASAMVAPTFAVAQSEPFIGQITVYGFNFCPRGWAKAEGQVLQIVDNTALFSLLGTTYGGDGRTTFVLPDLQGRVIVGAGMGPGLSDYRLGSTGGTEATSLTVAQSPSHAHNFNGAGALATTTVKESTNGNGLVSVVTDVGEASASTQNTGGGGAHNNLQPYIAMTVCIAVDGVFPPRN